jgi:hypothetical protein
MHRRPTGPSPACSTPARTTDGTVDGTVAELPTSRIEIAADYRYVAQETENIAEAKSLAAARPGDLPWSIHCTRSPLLKVTCPPHATSTVGRRV